MHTEMCLCCWPSFISLCLLKLYSDRSNKQECRGSGYMRRTIWESYTSVNKPKRLRVKKERFREWFLQILDPRVAYHWVLCNPTVKVVSVGKKLLNGHLKMRPAEICSVDFSLLIAIHTSDVTDMLWMLNTWGSFTVNLAEQCVHDWFWLHTVV